MHVLYKICLINSYIYPKKRTTRLLGMITKSGDKKLPGSRSLPGVDISNVKNLNLGYLIQMGHLSHSCSHCSNNIWKIYYIYCGYFMVVLMSLYTPVYHCSAQQSPLKSTLFTTERHEQLAWFLFWALDSFIIFLCSGTRRASSGYSFDHWRQPEGIHWGTLMSERTAQSAAVANKNCQGRLLLMMKIKQRIKG